jgi:hypothetical protein
LMHILILYLLLEVHGTIIKVIGGLKVLIFCLFPSSLVLVDALEHFGFD